MKAVGRRTRPDSVGLRGYASTRARENIMSRGDGMIGVSDHGIWGGARDAKLDLCAPQNPASTSSLDELNVEGDLNVFAN